MPYQNIHATISDADLNQAIQKIQEAKALLPFLVNLSKGEKRKTLQLGKKTEKFLFDVQHVMNTNPALVPGYVDGPGYNSDFNLLIRLQQIEVHLRMLTEAVNDTRFAVVQECQKPALAMYKNIQSAALANVPGADTVLNELKPYFKKVRKKKK